MWNASVNDQNNRNVIDNFEQSLNTSVKNEYIQCICAAAYISVHHSDRVSWQN
jgi:hypothetical protein